MKDSEQLVQLAAMLAVDKTSPLPQTNKAGMVILGMLATLVV